MLTTVPAVETLPAECNPPTTPSITRERVFFPADVIVTTAFRATWTRARSRTPGRDWAEIKARWRRWRRWRRIALKNVSSNVSLPRRDVPVGMADIRVPNHWVHPKIAGLHRGVPWAPVTWPRWMSIRTAGPGMVIQRHRARLGLGATCPQYPRDAAPQQHRRSQQHDEAFHRLRDYSDTNRPGKTRKTIAR